MNCPGCGVGMLALEFERLQLGVIALDFCFPCQVIWFDTVESLQLSPGGILEVFKTLHERRAPTRNTLPALLACPRCHTRLTLTHDLQHTTHFTYFRCEFGHGPQPGGLGRWPGGGRRLRQRGARRRQGGPTDEDLSCGVSAAGG